VPDGAIAVLPKNAIQADWNAELADWADQYLLNEFVVGVSIGDEQAAFPLSSLNSREIINAVVGGRPVAVTWCPLCQSSVIYSREFQNQTLTFGVSGMLFENALVMFDRETDSYWSHFSGRCLGGAFEGASLTMLAGSAPLRLGAWLDTHPDSQIYIDQGERDAVTNLVRTANGTVICLPSLDPPVAVEMGVLMEHGIMQFRHDDDTVVVYASEDLELIRAFIAPDSVVIKFEENLLIVDGFVHNPLTGKGAGTNLQQIVSFPALKQAWRDHHPDAAIKNQP
jgi:hypothetical protein